MKNYLALARVSSDEQEHGFSLDIQEDALREWAAKNSGRIHTMYRVAETAHKSEKRKTFHEMIEFAKKNKGTVHGLLFYKVDRAARNMKDWIDLVELRDKHGIEIVCITEPFDETPAGKLNSNMLAAISQFYSDQLSQRTQAGVERRVQTGLFPGHAPYGYKNYREGGRGLVRIDDREADNVRRIYELYAYHNHTLEMLIETLRAEGRYYRDHCHTFKRSKLHQILHDRSYLGEIEFRGQWHPGKHQPIIQTSLFTRVQTLMGKRAYRRYDSVYGSNLITCGHCGRPLVCELKRKKNGREYRYYRCSQYTADGHPKDRATESEFDQTLLAMFERMRIDDPKVRLWLEDVIRAKSRSEVSQNRKERESTRQELARTQKERDTLLDMMLKGHIEAEMYKRKDAELLSLLNHLHVRVEGQERNQSEIGDIAMKLLELSQTLKNKWVVADIPEKRALLEIVCLNLVFENATLVISTRKPFDLFVEGLQMKYGTGGWN